MEISLIEQAEQLEEMARKLLIAAQKLRDRQNNPDGLNSKNCE